MYLVVDGLRTIGDAMLESTKYEHNYGKPESHNLSGRVARSEAQHDRHADHSICWNSFEEENTPS